MEVEFSFTGTVSEVSALLNQGDFCCCHHWLLVSATYLKIGVSLICCCFFLSPASL